MSYTEINEPEDLQFIIANNELMIRFTCPRCGNKQSYPVNPEKLIHGFEIECNHPMCRKEDERYGFKLTMYPQWSAYILGTNDRPLHDV